MIDEEMRQPAVSARARELRCFVVRGRDDGDDATAERCEYPGRTRRNVGLVVLLSFLLGCGDGTMAPKPVTLDIGGLQFHVPDSEARVLPSNFKHREDIGASYQRVYDMTLCATFPDMTLRGDRLAIGKCLGIGSTPGPWMMLSVTVLEISESLLQDRRTTPLGRVAERLVTDGASPMGDSSVAFELGASVFELNVLQRKVPSQTSTDLRYWHGESVERATTLIECNTYAKSPVGTCSHSFTPFAVTGGRSAKGRLMITLAYHHGLLPRWQEIEHRSIELLRSLAPSSLLDVEKASVAEPGSGTLTGQQP